MPDPAAEIAALREDLRAMRDHVTALEGELRRAQQHVDLTMRGQVRCRACGCRRIAHALQVHDQAKYAGAPMTLAREQGVFSSRAFGQLEAYACTRCGAVEWYADPATLAEVEGKIRIVDNNVADGGAPYR